jgi:hypothetical protein
MKRNGIYIKNKNSINMKKEDNKSNNYKLHYK